MAKDVIAESVFRKDVGDQVAFIRQPIVCELLRAEDEHRAIPQLVIFDHGQRCKGLPETNAVGQDAAIVGLQLVNDSSCSVLLEIKQFVPHQTILIARAIIGENVGADVFQEFAEDIVEHHEVDALRRILLIGGRDVVAKPSR